MRILLVNAAKYDENGVRERYRFGTVPPSGLAILAARARRFNNAEVKIIDDWIEEIPFEQDFDLVGISTLFSATFPRVAAISKRFREKGIPVVLGGTHATCAPTEAAAIADSVIVGEGEELFEELLGDLGSGSGIKPQYKRNGFLDLEKLSYVEPDYTLIDLERYIKGPWPRTNILPVQTSRGCFMNCAFCSIHITGGRKGRYRPIGDVVKEIVSLKSKYGADYFTLSDDNLTLDPDRFEELMKQLRKLHIRFFCQIASTIIRRPKMIELLSDAGCASACIGVESTNQKSLEEVSKTFTDVRAYKEMFDLFRKRKVTAVASMIFGFDQDGPEVFSETVRFLNSCKVPRAVFSIMVPFPGTRVHAKMAAEARIEETNLSLYDLTHVVFSPKLMTKEQLQEGYWRAYEEFYRLGSIMGRVITPGHSSRLYTLFGSLTFRRQVRKRIFPYNSGYRRIIGQEGSA